VNLGTGLCDFCWEVQSRLRDYLQRGGDKAKAFVRKHLLLALASQEDTGIERKTTTNNLDRWLKEYAQLDLDVHVSPDVQTLVRRGSRGCDATPGSGKRSFRSSTTGRS
jgi:hypothetical protein